MSVARIIQEPASIRRVSIGLERIAVEGKVTEIEIEIGTVDYHPLRRSATLIDPTHLLKVLSRYNVNNDEVVEFMNKYSKVQKGITRGGFETYISIPTTR